jgi:hypothetical protein
MYSPENAPNAPIIISTNNTSTIINNEGSGVTAASIADFAGSQHANTLLVVLVMFGTLFSVMRLNQIWATMRINGPGSIAGGSYASSGSGFLPRWTPPQPTPAPPRPRRSRE